MTTAISDPVLDDIIRVIVDRFSPERVALFGSRARGDYDDESDYDIIVVLDTRGGRDERRSLIRGELGEHARRTDLFVYTPVEFERRRRDVGDIAYAAEVEGHILYDRTPGRWPRYVREGPPAGGTEPPESLSEWLARAKSDFDAMELLTANNSLSTDVIAFHAHQAIEKLLKSVLVSRHTWPPRTHLLGKLLLICPAELRDDPRMADACASLDKIFATTRYPRDPMPSSAQAARAVEDARAVREAVRARCSLS